MSPLALQYVISLLSQVPGLIAAGQSVVATVNQAITMGNTFVAEKRDPTDAEWASLDAARDALHKQIQS